MSAEFATEAERAVLSALVLFPAETVELITEEGVDSQWFGLYPQEFTLLHTMAAERRSMNIVTVTSAFRDAGLTDHIGGPAEITGLFTQGHVGGAFGSYIDILRTKFLARRAGGLAKAILATIADDPANAGIPLIEHITQEALTLAAYTARTTTIVPARELAIAAIEKLEVTYKNRGHTLGIPTGIHSLDRMTNGIMATHVYTVLARPSHGKSAFMAHIARHIGTNKNPYESAECLIFTMEMTGLQLVQRVIMTEAGISQQRVRDGLISDGYSGDEYREDRDDWKKIHRAAHAIGYSRIHVDTTTVLTAREIDQRIRRFVRTKRAQADSAFREQLAAESITGEDIETRFKQRSQDRKKSDRADVVIFIDYLQLIRASDPKQPRYLQIKEDMQLIAALAKNLHISIVLLAQLGRSDNEGPDKLPEVSDARESGDIETFSHEMILLHRPAMYLLDQDKAAKWCDKYTIGGHGGTSDMRVGTPAASGLGQRDLAHLIKIVVGKNREGPVGVVDVHFEPSLTKFDNLNPREKLFSNNLDEQQHTVRRREKEEAA